MTPSQSGFNEVTHLINSLLGFIVMPRTQVLNDMRQVTVSREGIPAWGLRFRLEGRGRLPTQLRPLFIGLRNAICHSQLDHIANADPSKPLVLGHESAGIVATGDRIGHVSVGDDVLITWLPRSGARKPQPVRIPLENNQVAITRNVYTWGTHALADEQYVVKVPTNGASISATHRRAEFTASDFARSQVLPWPEPRGTPAGAEDDSSAGRSPKSCAGRRPGMVAQRS